MIPLEPMTKGYIIESLFYVYSNDQLCEDVVTQTAASLKAWDGKDAASVSATMDLVSNL